MQADEARKPFLREGAVTASRFKILGLPVIGEPRRDSQQTTGMRQRHEDVQMRLSRGGENAFLAIMRRTP